MLLCVLENLSPRNLTLVRGRFQLSQEFYRTICTKHQQFTLKIFSKRTVFVSRQEVFKRTRLQS